MKKLWLIGLVIALTAVFSANKTTAGETYLVTKVIDGDTIQLENGERVRYIGINTPETKHPTKGVEFYGKEASEANKSLVKEERVRLEFDVQERDQYGRLLAYVWVGRTFVNAWLVENGFAQVMTIPPNVKYQETFFKLQEQAREQQVGLWATLPPATGPPVIVPVTSTENLTEYITRTGAKYHRAGCRYLSKSMIPISLQDAKARGYEPCSVCKPPR